MCDDSFCARETDDGETILTACNVGSELMSTYERLGDRVDGEGSVTLRMGFTDDVTALLSVSLVSMSDSMV